MASTLRPSTWVALRVYALVAIVNSRGSTRCRGICVSHAGGSPYETGRRRFCSRSDIYMLIIVSTIISDQMMRSGDQECTSQACVKSQTHIATVHRMQAFLMRHLNIISYTQHLFTKFINACIFHGLLAVPIPYCPIIITLQYLANLNKHYLAASS